MKFRLLLLAIAASVTLCTSLLLQPQHTLAADATQTTVTVETIPGPSVADKISEAVKRSWPWYLSRGSGLVAAITLILLMLSGIGQITGHTFRILDPLSAWASHRALGIVFTISVVLHIFSLPFDHFVDFSLVDVLIPWVSDFKPVHIGPLHVGSLYIALGILAFYTTIAIVVTSLLWINKKPKTWKFLHLLSYAAIAMVFVHALMLGTDLAHGWMRVIWIGSNIAILAGALLRALRAYTTS